MFIKIVGNPDIILLVYVDDIIMTGNCEFEISKVKNFLKSQFLIIDLEKLKYFWKLIGKLIYLTIVRPNSAYFVQVLSQYVHKPTKAHLQDALRLLRYLKHKGVSYLMSESDSLVLRGFSDADWAKRLFFRKFVSGHVLEYKALGSCHSAITLALNLVFHDKTKHFEINVHFIREKISKGIIKLVKNFCF
uniref:Reverse transcriptase Ty1/copia-type domain-containing protein n=1 Tax=Lactuca sativa TaxID=4236 RepID=A0A9R1UCL4_LACSA|nr:hypothetical protein LSAT_V11C900480800 [Lactuca sativa]